MIRGSGAGSGSTPITEPASNTCQTAIHFRPDTATTDRFLRSRRRRKNDPLKPIPRIPNPKAPAKGSRDYSLRGFAQIRLHASRRQDFSASPTGPQHRSQDGPSREKDRGSILANGMKLFYDESSTRLCNCRESEK